MIALLYFATAAALLFLAHRFVAPLARGSAMALLLLPLAFTGRAVLTGRIYAPVEIPYQVPPLSGHRQELRVGAVQNPMLTDIAFIIIPWREAVRRAVGEGEWPLLNRFEACGDPLAAAMQPAVYSPFTWIALLLPSAQSFTFTAAIAFFIAGLGAFLFARELGRSVEASLIAAAVFMFAAPMALQILWPLGFAWALLPLLFLSMRRAVLVSDLRSTTLLMVIFALQIVTGHPETLLHSVVIAAAYGLFELLRKRDRRLRAAGAVAVAGVVALLLTAVVLLPFLEAVRVTGEHWVRAEIYARAPLRITPGLPRAALLSDLFPFLRGRFDQLLLPRAEAGSIALALALVAIARIRSRETWFFAGLLLFALLAGIDAWPVAQLLHRLPLFDVAINDRLVSVVPFCLAILAAFSVDGLKAVPHGAAMIALCIIIGGAAIAIGPPLDRTRLIAELMPLALAAVAVFSRWRMQLLLGLILVQRVIADGALVPVHPPGIAYPSLALFRPLERVREPFRVVAPGATLLPNMATMYGLEDVRSNTAMTLAPFAETFPLWKAGELTRPIVSMMNVRYAVTETWQATPPGWREVAVDANSRLLENEHALPRAFVPRRVRFGTEHLPEMRNETDFAERAWIDATEPLRERDNGRGTVTARRNASGLRLDAVMERDGFIVVSESAWPGWRAYVDGRRVGILRANHVFLGIYVPAGRHEVRLRYLPQSFVVGRTISVAVALLLFAGLVIRQVV